MTLRRDHRTIPHAAAAPHGPGRDLAWPPRDGATPGLALYPHLPGLRSPLATWFAQDGAAREFRARALGRGSALLRPRDRQWRTLGPRFRDVAALAGAGSPFHLTLEDEVERSADPGRLPRALAEGWTVLFPQVHEVLPRLARLMVALRVAFFGPHRDECSFLFAVEGRGRPGMGLHHDGPVEAFWLQLEGRRTVTIGPPVPAGTPERIEARARPPGKGWTALDLAPGTLFYVPPWTPHRVVCRGRSLALTLTWAPPRPRAGAGHGRRHQASGLTAWPVTSGRVDLIPRASRSRLWTQVPALAGPVDRARGAFPLWLPDGAVRWLPPRAHAVARHLATMPSLATPRGAVERAIMEPLIRCGVLGPRDLPRRVIPAEPRALDGRHFA